MGKNTPDALGTQLPLQDPHPPRPAHHDRSLTWDLAAATRSLGRDHLGVLMGRGQLAVIHAHKPTAIVLLRRVTWALRRAAVRISTDHPLALQLRRLRDGLRDPDGTAEALLALSEREGGGVGTALVSAGGSGDDKKTGLEFGSPQF